LSEMTPPGDDNGIAIIGMAGRFPGAASVREFWANLRDGEESIRFFTTDELSAAGVDRAVCEDPRYVKAKAALDGVDRFDAGFFGYTPREAEFIDPQQRLFLESAWTAIENAGYDPSSCDVPVGVFAGQGVNSYWLSDAFRAASASMGALDVLISSDKDFLATRVSYKLNLKGPSIVVQTACSTSLVAVCEACNSLVSYGCDMALAGGVSVRLPRVAGYRYQQGSIASPDGHCRPFDEDSAGTVGGEGVGIVVLKRFADAVSDGDTIHAVIRGWAVNNDGSLKVGYTAPSVDGQAEVIAMAQALAGVEPEDISYVEAHGTGTPLGDPIEVAGLAQVFGPRRGGHPTCAIGSVKSNVGHLDAAAGVAGLIKTTMALMYREIPATLHFKRANPKIDLDRTPFYVNSQLRPWVDCPLPRRAGVSSFGIGGTNAHVVLEEAPTAEASSPSRTHQLLLLSARSADALDASTRALGDALEDGAERNLADVAYTLALGRRRFSQRRAIVCRGFEQAVESLRARDGGSGLSAECTATDRPVAFMFPGQGAQYVRMGAELYRSEPVFRQEIDRCAALLEPELGCDLRHVLYPTADPEAVSNRLMQTMLAQPSLFAVEYALARLWMSWGVQADAMIGHSIGEYVAACLAGVFSLEDGLKIVAARARIMQSAARGTMLSVALPWERLSAMLDEGISIAAINEPSSCVASGADDSVAALEARLAQLAVPCRRLHTSHAFHSHMMAPIMDSFGRVLAGVALHAPRIAFISNVSGTWIRPDEAIDPSYWVAQLRQTVRFADGIETLLSDRKPILLEVGPGNGLTALAGRSRARGANDVIAASMRHPSDAQSDVAVLLGAAARLWLAGAELDWREYYRNERRRRVSLPTYPFERERYWIGDSGEQEATRSAATRRRLPIEEWFSAPSWKRASFSGSAPTSTAAGEAERWLVLADECGVSSALVERLRSEGAAVIEARIGNEFAARGAAAFTLDPSRPEHYEALMKALMTGSGVPSRIVHSLGVTGAESFRPAALLERCFYSPMFLAQAIGRFDLSAGSRMLFVGDGMLEVTGDEDICPEKSTLIGPCRVIPREYPHIRCRLVDLPAVAVGRPQSSWIMDRLIAEAAIEDDASIVAYRGRHRWLQTFDRVELPRVGRTGGGLRDGGVYLVTGGLGGIGLALAKGIALEVRAKLVLLGRTALPPKAQWSDLPESGAAGDAMSARVAAVRDLESLGAEVMIATADATDAARMRTVIDTVRERYGEINGVIHAAGIAGGGIIQLKTRDAASRVLAPKVQGARVLLEALADSRPDFVLLCSSLAAITGIPGQIDYTAANAYLDALAQRFAQTGEMPVISVNWDTWRDAGMAVDATLPSALEASRRARLAGGIGAAEGVDAFFRIIGKGYAQIAVSTIASAEAGAIRPVMPAAEIPGARDAEPDAMRAAPGARGAAPDRKHARPALSTAYAAPRDGIESAIAAIWSELFGISGIGINDDFFELGGHSLLAIQVLSRINAEFGVELPVNDLFAGATVDALAQSVRGAHVGSGDREAGRLGDLLDTVEQLSDEDVKRLLEEHGRVGQ
jgi:acyl transferase domain-containing protein/acyl carrier protein